MHRLDIIALTLALGCVSCSRQDKTELMIPEGPPATIETLAEEEREIGPLPAVTKPLRRDACGIPLALTMESLLLPEGLREIQRELVDRKVLGRASYNAGELDEATVAALIEFQAREDLPAIGLPTFVTVRALGLEPRSVFVSGDPTCPGAHS